MTRYVLLPIAQEDLADIRDYYLREAGYQIARRMLRDFVDGFRFLAQTPGAGHKREDLAEARGILFWPIREHLIVYKSGTYPLQIVAILRGSQEVSKIIIRRGY